MCNWIILSDGQRLCDMCRLSDRLRLYHGPLLSNRQHLCERCGLLYVRRLRN